MDAEVISLSETIFTILLLTFLGYVVRRSVPDDKGKTIQGGLGYLLAHVALPALNFESIATLDLSLLSDAGTILFVGLLGKVSMMLVGYGIGRCTHPADAPDSGPAWAGAVALWLTNSDDIGLGYPLFHGALFPPLAGLLFLFAASQALLLSPVCYVLLSTAEPAPTMNRGSNASDRASTASSTVQSAALKRVLCELVQNKLIVSALVGLVYNLIVGNTLPWFIQAPIDTMGNAFECCVLLLGGMALVGSSKVVSDLSSAALPLGLVVIKVILMPIWMYLLAIAFRATEDQTNFLLVYGMLPAAGSTLVITQVYGSSERLRMLLASGFAIGRGLAFLLVFVFAALITFSHGEQLPDFVYIFSLVLQGLSLAGTTWVLLSALLLPATWRAQPTITRVLGLAAVDWFFHISFLAWGPRRIMDDGAYTALDRSVGWASVSFLRWASEGWLLVLCVDCARELQKSPLLPSSEDRSSAAPSAEPRKPGPHAAQSIGFYLLGAALLGVVTTLPWLFSPYPQNPFIGLWVLTPEQGVEDAIFYGLTSIIFAMCLGLMVKSSAGKGFEHIVPIGCLCVCGMVRSIGQCSVAGFLAGQRMGDGDITDGSVASQLVLTIFFGDGRGLVLALLFGTQTEHVEALRAWGVRLEQAVRTPFEQVARLRGQRLANTDEQFNLLDYGTHLEDGSGQVPGGRAQWR